MSGQRRRGLHDWTGETWGSLLCVRYVNHGINGARWVFRCDCRREKIMPLRFVRNGKRTTCGACKPVAQAATPDIGWPFPRVIGTDGKPLSPVWRAHAAT